MHPLTTDPERLGTTQLDDGRNLAWAEWIYAEPAYRRALREGFMGGSSGYARDTALAMSQWPFAAAALLWTSAREILSELRA